MRALLDIGKERLQNPDAEINALQEQLSLHNVSEAMVVECSNDNFKTLYCYNDEKSLILTMSMIKLLTALVVLDNVKDLDQYVKITKADIRITNNKFFSGAVFSAGQTVKYRDLLYAMMLPSSNQAAFILARSVGKKL